MQAPAGQGGEEVNVAVVGAGSWGTTFAAFLDERGHDVTLVCRDSSQADAIRESGRNPRSMPEADLTEVDACMIDEVDGSHVQLLCIAVPSSEFRAVVGRLPSDVPVLNLTKGLDPTSGERLSTFLPGRPVAVLSGPNHAEEIVRGQPAAAVVASSDQDFATALQHELISPRLRIYLNADVVGVELCAAAKNVIGLAAGGVDGMRAGDNAKAALITRGLAEMSRLGDAQGARPETFAGLAGMGDLIVTCWSRHSRNRLAGELIASGASAQAVESEVGMVVEGVHTAPALRDLGHRLELELPITEAVCRVLEGVPIRELVPVLMGRRPTEE